MTANCTAAYVYRKIAEDPRRLPTLLLDEADTHLSAGGLEHEALRGIINAGYRQGVGAGRADGRKHGPVEYPTFCPAAMAGIGDLQERSWTAPSSSGYSGGP